MKQLFFFFFCFNLHLNLEFLSTCVFITLYLQAVRLSCYSQKPGIPTSHPALSWLPKGSVTPSSSILSFYWFVEEKVVTLIWIKMKIFLMAPCGVRQFGHLKWLPLFNLTCSDRDLCVHVSLPASYICKWLFLEVLSVWRVFPLALCQLFPLSSLPWLDS